MIKCPSPWVLVALLLAPIGCAAGSSVGQSSGSGVGGAGGDDVLTSNGPAGGSLPNASTTTASGNGSSTGATSGNASSTSSSSATASSSKAAGGGNGKFCDTLSITASNQACSDCLETYCCKPIHGCIDADLISCMACLDCFLEGKGAACCDEKVGKNVWIEECVDFNCSKECG